jgi:hypothetical protein
MNAVIFAGPSLPPSVRPAVAGLDWRPPVRQGDLYMAARQAPPLIVVIDGYFELVPTVWHKEILWAMARGIHVYGAASTGALRAAELADLGMIGVGKIYRQFRNGDLTDDDEVAVLHGPAGVDYVQVTEAMVNVRATIKRAAELGVIEPNVAAELVQIAKSMFYKDRTYETIVRVANEQGISSDALSQFASWLPNGQIDQKRRDSTKLLQVVTAHLARGVPPLQVSYQFAHTFAWEEARQRIERVLDRAASPIS